MKCNLFIRGTKMATLNLARVLQVIVFEKSTTRKTSSSFKLVLQYFENLFWLYILNLWVIKRRIWEHNFSFNSSSVQNILTFLVTFTSLFCPFFSLSSVIVFHSKWWMIESHPAPQFSLKEIFFDLHLSHSLYMEALLVTLQQMLPTRLLKFVCCISLYCLHFWNKKKKFSWYLHIQVSRLLAGLWITQKGLKRQKCGYDIWIPLVDKNFLCKICKVSDKYLICFFTFFLVTVSLRPGV